VSPDGTSVFYQAFSSWTAGQLMRVPINGGPSESILTITSAPEPVSFMGIDGHLPPRCAKSPATLCAIAERTADERHLVFSSFDGMKGRGRELIRFNIDPSGIYRWDVSSDGACIAILKLSQNHIHILGMHGQPERDIEVEGWNNLENVNWAADGKGLFVSSPKKGNSVLLYVDLNGRATAMWEQPGELEGNLDTYAIPSPDGQHLALFGWTSNSNMWMLENF
jgi:WD40 repeat protein